MSACAMDTFKTFFLQDKVGNIWCSISVLIKVKRVLTQTQIIKLRLVIAFYARDWVSFEPKCSMGLFWDPVIAITRLHRKLV